MSRVEPSLGLVVVAYQSEAYLGDFFRSLEESEITPAHVVVVDNSPSDPISPESSQLPPVTTIHRPDNPGYGSAANVGVQSLPDTCEWIVVCNPDIIVDSRALKTLLEWGQRHPEAGLLGPAIRNIDGSLYPSARALPTIGIGIGHALFSLAWSSNPWTRAYRGDYESSESRAVGWLSGAFLMIRRTTWDTVGGFDEGYFMFFEDVDLGWRIGDAGYRNLYVPDASATHLGGQSTQLHPAEMIQAHHSSAMRFISKRYPGRLWWAMRHLINLGLTIRERLLRARAVAD